MCREVPEIVCVCLYLLCLHEIFSYLIKNCCRPHPLHPLNSLNDSFAYKQIKVEHTASFLFVLSEAKEFSLLTFAAHVMM